MCPTTLISRTAKEHLGSLRVIPLVSSFVRSWFNCCRCVALSGDHIQMLSEMFATPEILLIKSCIISWKCSPHVDAPIITRVNRCEPSSGIRKAVMYRDSSVNVT